MCNHSSLIFRGIHMCFTATIRGLSTHFFAQGILLPAFLLLVTTGLSAQVGRIVYRSDASNNFIRLDLLRVDGQSLILPLSADSAKNPWRIARCTLDTVARKLVETTPPLFDSLQNLHSFYYDSASGRVAVAGERDSTAGKGTGERYSFVSFADPLKPKLIVKSFSNPHFDAQGYVGCLDKQDKLFYVRYNGDVISLPQSLQPSRLGAINDSGFSIIQSNSGYCLYDARANAVLSGFYRDDMWSFLPNVFVAKSNEKYTVLRVESNTRTLDSSLNGLLSLRTVEGKRPCLDLLNPNLTHTLLVNAEKIFPVPDFGSKGDTLMGYAFEDSVMIRYTRSALEEQVYAAFHLASAAFTPDTLFRLPYGYNSLVYPFSGSRYLLQAPGKPIFIVSGRKNDKWLNRTELTGPGRLQYFRIATPWSKKHSFFFFVVNDVKNRTHTLLLNISGKGAPTVDTLDQSVCSYERAFVAFLNNVLAIRDEGFTLEDNVPGGWKFLDGYKASYPMVVQSIAANETKIALDKKQLFYGDKAGALFPPFFVLTVPLPANKELLSQKILVYHDGKRQHAGLLIDYKRPPSGTPAPTASNPIH